MEIRSVEYTEIPRDESGLAVSLNSPGHLPGYIPVPLGNRPARAEANSILQALLRAGWAVQRVGESYHLGLKPPKSIVRPAPGWVAEIHALGVLDLAVVNRDMREVGWF